MKIRLTISVEVPSMVFPISTHAGTELIQPVDFCPKDQHIALEHMPVAGSRLQKLAKHIYPG